MNRNQNFNGRPNFRRYNNYFKPPSRPNPLAQQIAYNKEDFSSKNKQDFYNNTEAKIPMDSEHNYNNNRNHNEIKSESNQITSTFSEDPIFEFHGIKLYTDDLLILLLMYFLYREKVNDNLLYIALFALLFF